jgi:hypothetical protein
MGQARRLTLREIDHFAENLIESLDGIGLLEVAGIISDLEGMVAQAKDAAATASVGALMNLAETAMNPGQKVITENYLLEIAESYWQEIEEQPDPEAYEQEMYAAHEAVEQALSEAVSMSYEAGRSAGLQSIYEQLTAFIAAEVLERGFSKVEAKGLLDARSSGFFSDDTLLDLLGDSHRYQQFKRGEDVEGWTFKKTAAGRIEGMFIGDGLTFGSYEGATRQLPWSMVASPRNRPFWFTEQQRINMAALRGYITPEEKAAMIDELYSSTYSNPWSTTAPAGYDRWDAPPGANMYGLED